MKAPYYQDDWVTLYCADCAEVLPEIKRHDLLLTDPPYGIGESNERNSTRRRLAAPTDYGHFEWDRESVPQMLIDRIIKLVRLAIIFGGNFYTLPATSCWLVWDKKNGANDFADCELAWTNLKGAVRLYKHLWHGMLRKNGEDRFHPTQKPVDVMSWAISLAGEVSSVFDPFCGSGTTLVAAKLRNIRSTGIEREERYCEIAANRLQQEVLNLTDQALIQRAREAAR